MHSVRFDSLMIICLVGLLGIRVLATALPWNELEKRRVESLTLSKLPETPNEAKNNSWVGNYAAEQLGAQLFVDPGLSRGGKISCSSCHESDKLFSSHEVFSTGPHGPRSVPSLMAVAWQSFYYWDGRKDSLWSQAIEPLLNPMEHNISPQSLRKALLDRYLKDIHKAFGELITERLKQDMSGETSLMVFGKAVSAYLSSFRVEPTAFDRFASQLAKGQWQSAAISACAQRGLKLFIGKGMCINCHNGPLFSNDDFHNTGVPMVNGMDNPTGRVLAISTLLGDRFSCLSKADHIDPKTPDCGHVKHMQRSGMRLSGAFKTPTLRGVSKTSPYMHNGAFKDLSQVIRHYALAKDGPVGFTELLPLDLSSQETKQLECFLRTL